jgi:hypothetical protein
MNSLAMFFIEKTRFLSKFFFSYSKYGMRAYWSFSVANPRIFLFYAFLGISLRKINIFQKTKLDLLGLAEIYNKYKKQPLLNLTNILKSTTKNVKKEKKKSAQNFSILKYIIKSFKATKFYY